MDERVDKEKTKKYMSPERKEALRRNLAKARAVRMEKINARKKALAESGDAQGFSGAGATEIVRKMLLLLSSRFGDGRISKRSCLLCETQVPNAPDSNYKNPCVCQEAWEFVDFVDTRDQERLNAERQKTG